MEILKFVKWQWNKFEFWQKTFLLSVFLMIVSLFFDHPNNFLIIAAAFSIVTFWTFKWFVVDVLVKNYYAYQKEKSSLFERIKESDNK